MSGRMLKFLMCLHVVSSITIADIVEYHAHPQYSFEYGVNDPSTQDVKKQWETRDGDKVQGSYSFKEADGTIRIVEYHANDRVGFNAVVRREGHAVHPPTYHPVHEPVIYTPTIVHTSLNPVESLSHTPMHIPHNAHTPSSTSSRHQDETVHTAIHSPHHANDQSSARSHNSRETVIYTPVHTIVHKPTHKIVHSTVSTENPVETSVHPPTHSVVHTSVRSPVHITPIYTTHASKTPMYSVVHHAKKTSTPIETTVHVPINYPEVAVTKIVKERKEPEVYNSQIAGAHTASLISGVPHYYNR